MPRVVASLTTLPGRYPKLLRTLRSLHAQDRKLDAIYLGIPQKSRRLNAPYPELPHKIRELATVIPCEHDYGPATKIVGGLLAEDEPDTIIITFDDDVVYSPNVVSSLLSYAEKFPHSAIGSSGIILKYGFPFYSTISNCHNHWNSITGFSMGPDGRAVDALCGFSGVLYVRNFFPPQQALYEEFLHYPLDDEDVYRNDDIMISAYLSGQHVERRVVPNIPVPNETKEVDPELDALDGNELSFDKLAFLQRFRRAINTTQEWGFFSQTEDVPVYETIGGRILIIILVVLTVILILLLAWKFLDLGNELRHSVRF